MLRVSALLLSVAAILFSAAAARAGELYADAIKVTGTFSQGPAGGADGIGVTKPLKIADILAFLNITGVDPDTLKFFYDDTEGTYVLAAKTTKDGDNVTPTATFLTFTDDYTTVFKSAKKAVSAGGLILFNETINGSYSQTISFSATKETDVYTITAYGVINERETILKITFRTSFPFSF